MNVIEQTSVSAQWPSLRGMAFATEPPCSNMASTFAGYAPSNTGVNASDRPQADRGQRSPGVAATSTPEPAAPPAPAPQAPPVPAQKASFRLDLLSPYGHVFA